MGTPTQGHQCYRLMAVDHDYCFDPTTQSNCYREPEPLLYGRTVFFTVQPKYLNVDIRVTIDVTYGGECSVSTNHHVYSQSLGYQEGDPLACC